MDGIQNAGADDEVVEQPNRQLYIPVVSHILVFVAVFRSSCSRVPYSAAVKLEYRSYTSSFHLLTPIKSFVDVVLAVRKMSVAQGGSAVLVWAAHDAVLFAMAKSL